MIVSAYFSCLHIGRELNPDELLNHDIKANAVGRQRPKNQAEMIANIRSYLRSTQCQASSCASLLSREARCLRSRLNC